MGSGGTDASTFFGGYVGSRIKTFNAQISLIDSGMVNFPKLRNVERGGDLGSFRGIGGYEQ